MRVSTIRPGLLIGLKSTVTGNVSYAKKIIEDEHEDADGALVSMWETERAVQKPDEYKEAIEIRSKCRWSVVRLCSPTNFGLLCPESKMNELGAAIDDAQQLANEFNRRAEKTRITVSVIIGRVAQDDVQAVRAINGEVRDLIETMERGLQKLDTKAVRDAAEKAKKLGSMLSEDAAERIKEAINLARKAARQIVKAGETGAAAVDEATLTKLRQSRTQFLDLDNEETEIAAPESTGRAIDLETDEEAEAAVLDPVQRIYDEAFEDEPVIATPRAAVPALEVTE